MTDEQAQTVAEIRNRNYFQTTRGTAINKLLSDKNDKHGYILMFEGQEPKFVYTELLYFGPKFSSVSVGLKALDSHGGPDVVRERLAMGWV